jgi:hypothetical protein
MVKHLNVAQWLQHLKEYSPAYRDIHIDFITASRLPEYGDLLDQLTTVLDDSEDASAPLDTGPPDSREPASTDTNPPVFSVVPNLSVSM